MNEKMKSVSPNLPKGKVSAALIDFRMKRELKSSLRNMGIDLIEVTENKSLDRAISSHPDMNFLNFSKGCWFTYQETNVLNCSIKEYLPEIRKIKDKAPDDQPVHYPKEAQLNALMIGSTLICNTKGVNREILEQCESMAYKIIHVNQGYTKCSVCIVSENALITEDEGIYKSLTRHGFEILLLKQKAVLLPPYPNGFIGGASGKLSEHILAFCGDIKLHPEYEEIKCFCNNYSVDLLSLGPGMLRDYGSVLAISESL